MRFITKADLTICAEETPGVGRGYCRHPARFRIQIEGGLILVRCGNHARWYRKSGATVTDRLA